MEKVTISRIDENGQVFGQDADGVEVLITKSHRLHELSVGTVINGYYLNEEENEDEFYFEAASVA